MRVHVYSEVFSYLKAFIPGYFKLMESEWKTKIDLSAQRAQLAADIKWDDIPKVNIKSLPAIHYAIRKAAKEAKEARMTALEDRAEHLDECAEFWTTGEEEAKAKYVRQMNHREKQAAVFRKFKAMRGKSQVGTLTSLSIPTKKEGERKDWTWKKVLDQTDMTQHLIARNKPHFGQANGTPLTNPKLVKTLGRHGEGGLEGLMETDLEGQTEETILLLEGLKQNRLPEITKLVTIAHLRSRIKVWPERKSTSPSGRTLSHYHAIIAPEEHDPITERPRGDNVLEIMAILINICVHHGIVLAHWLHVTQYNVRKSDRSGRNRQTPCHQHL
jgi:hypothetical protein